MASIVSTGIGSGLDVSGIVQNLVSAEGAPAETRIGQKEARAQARLSAFGTLKSALSDFRGKLEAMNSTDEFLVRQAISGDEESFTAKATGAALPANYKIEVVQLASPHKLTSEPFTGSGAELGTGTLLIGVGAAIASIEITEEQNTLAGIRDAINASSDNPGVVATIVNADTGSYLILSADAPGTANGITVRHEGGDGGLAAIEHDPLAGQSRMTETEIASDAHIRVDGLDVFGSTNSIEGAIDGVTIDLEKAAPGTEVSFRVENDESAARQLVGDFVDSYNSLVSTLDGLTDYNPEESSAGPLLGDATVRGIRDQIRRELSVSLDSAESPFGTLGEIGIETQLDGTLTVNDAELGDALSAHFTDFGKLFAADEGFATRLESLTESFLGSSGIVETRSQGLQAQIESLGDQRIALNERLAALETRLLRQFNALDSLLAQLSSTSNFLAQQLGNLPGVERSGQ